jgi:hypothetical protein
VVKEPRSEGVPGILEEAGEREAEGSKAGDRGGLERREQKPKQAIMER